MRKIFALVAVAVGGMTLVGCQMGQPQAPKTQESSRAVLDVHATRPTASRFAAPVQETTAPTEPAVAIAVEPVSSITPSAPATQSPARKAPAAHVQHAAAHVQQVSDKSSYRVKKGDTLYRIARSEYGDGKKWTLIASANPGLSPQSLRTGQTIVIP